MLMLPLQTANEELTRFNDVAVHEHLQRMATAPLVDRVRRAMAEQIAQHVFTTATLLDDRDSLSTGL